VGTLGLHHVLWLLIVIHVLGWLELRRRRMLLLLSLLLLLPWAPRGVQLGHAAAWLLVGRVLGLLVQRLLLSGRLPGHVSLHGRAQSLTTQPLQQKKRSHAAGTLCPTWGAAACCMGTSLERYTVWALPVAC
jgi:hypothetical protein